MMQRALIAIGGLAATAVLVVVLVAARIGPPTSGAMGTQATGRASSGAALGVAPSEPGPTIVLGDPAIAGGLEGAAEHEAGPDLEGAQGAEVDD